MTVSLSRGTLALFLLSLSSCLSWIPGLLTSLSVWVLRSLGCAVHLLACCSARAWRSATASFAAVFSCLLRLSLSLGPSLSVCVSHILSSSICQSRCFRVCVLAPPHSPSQLWAKNSSFQRLPRSAPSRNQPPGWQASAVVSKVGWALKTPEGCTGWGWEAAGHSQSPAHHYSAGDSVQGLNIMKTTHTN